MLTSEPIRLEVKQSMNVKSIYAMCIFILSCTISGSSFAQANVAPSSTEIFARHLRLNYGGVPVLVEVLGVCRAGREIVDMPPLESRSDAARNKSGKIHHIIMPEKYNVTLTKIENGIVVIKWPGVSNQLLNVKISSMKLSDAQRYSVDDILSELAHSHEARLEMANLKMRRMIKAGGLVNLPSPGQPRLGSLPNEATFSDVLKTILHSFNGILFYKECALSDGHRRLDFEYFPPRGLKR